MNVDTSTYIRKMCVCRCNNLLRISDLEKINILNYNIPRMFKKIIPQEMGTYMQYAYLYWKKMYLSHLTGQVQLPYIAEVQDLFEFGVNGLNFEDSCNG